MNIVLYAENIVLYAEIISFHMCDVCVCLCLQVLAIWHFCDVLKGVAKKFIITNAGVFVFGW